MDLSIIIPVFEESKKIIRDIEAASAFLMSNRLKGEIIIVDDGSSDNTSNRHKGVPRETCNICRQRQLCSLPKRSDWVESVKKRSLRYCAWIQKTPGKQN